MNDFAYESALKSLGHLIEKLRNQTGISETSELGQIIDNCGKFYDEVNRELTPLLEELGVLRHENARLSGEFDDIPPTFDEIIPLYEKIHVAGGDVELICKVAIANDVDAILVLKIMRTLFDLTLPEAKAIYDRHS